VSFLFPSTNFFLSFSFKMRTLVHQSHAQFVLQAKTLSARPSSAQTVTLASISTRTLQPQSPANFVHLALHLRRYLRRAQNVQEENFKSRQLPPLSLARRVAKETMPLTKKLRVKHVVLVNSKRQKLPLSTSASSVWLVLPLQRHLRSVANVKMVAIRIKMKLRQSLAWDAMQDSTRPTT